METTKEDPSDQEKESPPLFKSWSGWYGLLMGVLVSLIGLFYWFTQAFS